jgi:hypothetical protein
MSNRIRLLSLAAFSFLLLTIGINIAAAQDNSVFDKKPVLILSGVAGDHPGQFGTVGKGDGIGPMDFAVDTYDNIWIMDVMNQRVQKFDKNGKFLLEYPNEKAAAPVELLSRFFECTPSGDIIIGPMSEGEMVILNNNGEYQRTITLPGIQGMEFDFAVNGLSEIIYPRGNDTIITDLNGKVLRVIEDRLGISGKSSSPYTKKIAYDSGESTQTITNSSLTKIKTDSKTIKNEELDTGIKECIVKFILMADPFDNLFVQTNVKVEPSNRAIISYNDSNGRLIKVLEKTEGQAASKGSGYKTFHIDKDGNLYALEVITPEKATLGKSLSKGINLLKGGNPFVYLWKWER